MPKRAFPPGGVEAFLYRVRRTAMADLGQRLAAGALALMPDLLAAVVLGREEDRLIVLRALGGGEEVHGLQGSSLPLAGSCLAPGGLLPASLTPEELRNEVREEFLDPLLALAPRRIEVWPLGDTGTLLLLHRSPEPGTGERDALKLLIECLGGAFEELANCPAPAAYRQRQRRIRR